MNITPEKDLTHRRRHCRRFLHKETVITIATIANDVSSQQWQWCGQATEVETEAAAGAHNNQLPNGSDMAAETAFTAEFVATLAAVAAAVATAVVGYMALKQVQPQMLINSWECSRLALLG